jgi:hypothetical protein
MVARAAGSNVKDRRAKKQKQNVKEGGGGEMEKMLEDMDMEDSALLAQKLLRRLQRQA